MKLHVVPSKVKHKIISRTLIALAVSIADRMLNNLNDHMNSLAVQMRAKNKKQQLAKWHDIIKCRCKPNKQQHLLYQTICAIKFTSDLNQEIDRQK